MLTLAQGARGTDDAPALRGEEARDLRADAAAGTGDQHDLAVEAAHDEAPLVQRHEDAVTQLVADGLRQMALAPGVLDQDHLAGADLPRLAVTGRDLHAGVEVDDVLAARRGMPGEVVVRRDLAKDDAGGWQVLREFARRPAFRVLDLLVLEVRLALVVDPEPMDFHGGRSYYCRRPYGAVRQARPGVHAALHGGSAGVARGIPRP